MSLQVDGHQEAAAHWRGAVGTGQWHTAATVAHQVQHLLSPGERCHHSLPSSDLTDQLVSVCANQISKWSKCAWVVRTCRDLEVYRTLLTKGGRIVFEVAVDYSQTAHIWKDMIRLWVCV